MELDMIQQAFQSAAFSSRQSSPIQPEAAMMELRAVYERYAQQLQGPRFKPGDWVTPVANGSLKRAGQPHIVLETTDGVPAPRFYLDAGASTEGRRLDIRVAAFVGADFNCWWTESFEFVPWTAPVATES